MHLNREQRGEKLHWQLYEWMSLSLVGRIAAELRVRDDASFQRVSLVLGHKI